MNTHFSKDKKKGKENRKGFDLGDSLYAFIFLHFFPGYIVMFA